MTPGINVVIKAKIPHRVHEYTHDQSSESYGLEAAQKLAVPADQVFKTLVISLDGDELAVAVIPVSQLLGMKRVAKVLGVKKALMANQRDVERSTGYVLGGVSPLGQKKRLRTVIDISAREFESIFVSAGRRGLEIELSPDDLKMLANGIYGDICQ